MGRLDDRLNEHPFRERLTGLRSQLDSVSESKRKEADKQDPSGTLNRLDTVLEFVEAITTGADARLFSTTMLDNADAQLQQVESAMTGVVDQENYALLATIDGACDDLLNQVGSWPTSGLFEKGDVRKVASSFGRAAEERLGPLTRRADDLRDDLTGIEEAAEEKRQQIEAQQGQLRTSLDAQQSQVDQLIATSQQHFEAAQGERDTEFKALQEELREQVKEQQQSLSEAADGIENDLKERADSIFKSIEEKRDRAEKLVDLVATSATAGAFGKEADEQKGQADAWRKNAIIAASVAAAVTLLALIYAVFVETSTTLIVTKGLLSVFIAGVAGYLARQSAQHRRREIRARRLFLELTAFSPFSEALDDPEKEKEVRAQFIDRLFVGDPQITDTEAGLSKEDISLFNQAADVFKRVRA